MQFLVNMFFFFFFFLEVNPHPHLNWGEALQTLLCRSGHFIQFLGIKPFLEIDPSPVL